MRKPRSRRSANASRGWDKGAHRPEAGRPGRTGADGGSRSAFRDVRPSASEAGAAEPFSPKTVSVFGTERQESGFDAETALLRKGRHDVLSCLPCFVVSLGERWFFVVSGRFVPPVFLRRVSAETRKCSREGGFGKGGVRTFRPRSAREKRTNAPRTTHDSAGRFRGRRISGYGNGCGVSVAGGFCRRFSLSVCADRLSMDVRTEWIAGRDCRNGFIL